MRPILLVGVLLAATAVHARDVPFVKQKTNFCGPAALAAVMSSYGLPIDQDEIAQRVFSEKLKGALITDLENFARTRSFMTRTAVGTIDDLDASIRKGRPVIVLVDRGWWIIQRPHYLVIIGRTTDGFIAHTGHEPSVRITAERLASEWKRMGSVYLLVYR